MARLVFDMQDCGRCGGSGRMPFSVHNGVCFKCNGNGKAMTAKGRRAYAAMLEVQKDLCSVPASALVPGDRILNSDNRVVTVTEVKVKLGKGNGSGKQGVEGTDSYVEYWNFGETVISVNKGWGHAGPAHRSVTKAWTSETLAQAADRLKNFKGVTYVTETKECAA